MDASTTTRSRDRLSEAKRLLLEKRIRGQARPAESRHAIRRVGGGPVFPMSYAQERMWFLDQMEPGNPFYNIPMAVLISARVDVPTLERALTEVITRHEALRTVYQLVDGQPRQIVQPPHPVPVHLHDMRGPGGEPATDEAIRARIGELGARPFDIAHGPVVRVDLIRVSEADCALLINVHHIATDGWSMPIVTREMEQLYEAFAHHRPHPLQPLEIQYADYSLWQREYLTGETLRRHVDYWRGHLLGAPTLDLPTDRPRPPVLSYRGTMQRFVWPPAMTQRLHAFCVDAGASMNMVVMAGFYLMLHRYSGQDDVVVGTLLGNRNRSELESLVGFLVNSAPVRARVRDGMTFRELVTQVRGAVLDADAHQDLPFDKIVDALGAERDPSRSPLFQVMYFHHTFVNNDVHHLRDSEFQSELNLRSLFQETGVTLVETNTTKFDLTFATLEHEGVLACMCEYATDLWDDETVTGMMDHCRVLLDRAVAAPDAPLASLSMVTDDERERLRAWGAGEPVAPVEGTAVDRFRAHAARAPRATALVGSGGKMTYGELEARAAALARRLAAAGVRAEMPVAVLAEHSPAAVAAMLGVMMAGGAYLPLDPALPAARLAWTLEDAGAVAVVVEPHLAAHLPETTLPVLPIGGASADAEVEAPLPAIDPRSLAYVLYTSGSTGTPKGVGVSHDALAVHLASAARRYGLTEADRVLAFAAPSFDPSLEQVLAPLAAGASVALREARLWTPGELAEALERMGVTVLNPPTAYWHALVQDAPAAERVKRAVRLVIAGGEAMRADAAERWSALPGGAVLLNAYGPTEAVVTACAAQVGEGGKPAIGAPLPGRVVRVLDAGMRPAAIGVPGELCIGGPALARGYLRRPGLTAAAFVPDPSGAPGSRLYRTGDRVRWLRTGELDYLGRTDAQVKVRGFRIEPGEVEAGLRAHPVVREAAAAVREDVPGDRRLVAYVVAWDGAVPDAEELRAFLKGRLPDYMVPSAYVALDELPLTPGGKVDVRALPAPEARAAADSYQAPRNQVEQVLAELWAGVLRVERVGIHDNFFGLGGDSILSIQIIARAAEQGIRIVPLQMFTHQTIAELAAVATSTDAADAAPRPADDTPFALAGLDDDALNDLLSRMG